MSPFLSANFCSAYNQISLRFVSLLDIADSIKAAKGDDKEADQIATHNDSEYRFYFIS